MADPRSDLLPPPRTAESTPGAPTLFSWSGGEVVLFGERDGERWVVARGWRRADRLSDVRRWSYADPLGFAVQVRRLAREATGDRNAARLAGDAAAAWAESAPG